MKKLITPEIYPIAWPYVDWNTFVHIVNSHTGRSPTRELDRKNIPVGNIASFLSALQSFQNAKIGSVFRHLSFTFLCEMPEKDFQNLLSHGTDLKITTSPEGMFVLSGTLDIFYREIIEKCDEEVIQSVRLFYNCLYLIFKTKLHLDIWTFCIRHELSDGTFSLDYK